MQSPWRTEESFTLSNSGRSRNCLRLFLFLFASVTVLVSGSESNAFAQTPTSPSLLPYIVTAVAGGASANPTASATCPVSGFTSSDAFGDGCLATEVKLSGPRFVTQDTQGNFFFSDTGNALVRRIDATTGVVSLVAGGAAANPASGASCGSGSTATSLDADGDGCLGTQVKLGKPHGLAFSPSGDLYFADNSFSELRRIAATNGLITNSGVITLAAGNITTYGYSVNTYGSGTTPTATVSAASAQSYLNDPSGIVFDKLGNLYIADEGNNAIEVINFTSSSQTIMGLTVPVGTIAKLMGYGSLGSKTAKSGECPNFVSNTTNNHGGCYFSTFTNGAAARSSNVDSVYDVAVDNAGNIYFANEFNDNVGMIAASNAEVNNYAGIQGTIGTSITARGLSTSVGIGSDFSVALDQSANLYIPDASGGVIWRVDAGSNQMYVMAGGAATNCSSATDSYGDGCPATQATFTGAGIGKFASASTLGVAGVRVDSNGDVLVTDATTNLIRKITTGTQFGSINGSKPTQKLDIHFGVGDAPASYTLTSGASNFVLGSALCTLNSDKTQDCILPVQATPTIPGAFSATLTVTGTSGLSSPLTLSGIFNPIPVPSTTTIAVGTTNGCTGTTVAPGTQITITSTSTGAGGTPSGTVTFFNGTTQIGTPQTLNSSGQASITTTVAGLGNESITAVYNGDAFFLSSSAPAATLNVVTPSFATTLNSQQQNTVAAGQSALYAINVASTVYTGNITFSCTGLPAGSSCIFSPTTIAETGCSSSQTVTLTIATTQPTPVKQSSFAASPFGRGPWAAFGMVPGLFMAFLITLRRRKNPSMKYGQIWLAIALLFVASGASACGGGTKSTPGTPAGTSTVTVMASGTGVNSAPLNVTLTVQ